MPRRDAATCGPIPEELDATWRTLSVQDRFTAIVESRPVGFGIALAMIVAAIARVFMSFRAAK